ncbi:hypothetical protein K438DRAFT_1763545 [Mycena galopus ATCC 62051]|nr:hypothetical protein K438DRAFT_2162882 [Mycena galopus ATCC 62051]KAF8189928.1 hypothetical protein K438DRAFT_1763545 [Mycena galopus ATCC 62051]
MQLVLRTTDLEVVTQQCHHAKDELKGAKKKLIELSGALSRMTASLQELEAEISHKNHMAEDSARTVIVLKQEIKVSNKQIAELGYSRATLRDGMALKITELEEATLQCRQTRDELERAQKELLTCSEALDSKTASMQELEARISSKDHTAEESEQTIVAFQQEIKTTELEQAKDELKKAQKELVELSDALCVESASIQKLQREILRKNIILEDCEEKKMRYLTSQVVELVDSEAMSTEAMVLRATELQDLVYDLQHQMLRKDAVVGDLQEQVSEAHSTNSDLLAHNIQLNIHQRLLESNNIEGFRTIQNMIIVFCTVSHTILKLHSYLRRNTEDITRLKMASEISDAEYSSLSSLIVRSFINDIQPNPEELTWGSSKKSQVKKNLYIYGFINSCKSIKQNDHVECDHVF